RDQAYVGGGREIVDLCDVLFALWDGKAATGRGGTAEVVEYARQLGRPLLWLDTTTQQIHEEWGAALDAQAITDLGIYNAEPMEKLRLHQMVTNRLQFLQDEAKKAGFSAHQVPNSLGAALVPHFVKADALALAYQRRYFRAGTWIYSLAAAAVAVAA